MKRYPLILSAALLLTFLLVLTVVGQHEQITRERIEYVKQKTGFTDWKGTTGIVIAGASVTEDMLPELRSLKKIGEDNYSIEKVDKTAYVKISKRWRSGENGFEAIMVVAPSLEAAREFLIRRYAETQEMTPAIKNRGQKLGLSLGDVCFGSADSLRKRYSEIDFIRNNVVFLLRADGIIQNKLKSMAEKLDRNLALKKRGKEYRRFPDFPTIKLFVAEKTEMVSGESIPLVLEIDNPGDRELRYFWDISSGGVSKNMHDRFIFYCDGEGEQTITVIAVNDLGLYDTASVTIMVSKPKHE